MSVICYQISPENVNSHLFRVTLEFDCLTGQCYRLSLPAWLPGSYMIRDFAKNIIQLTAIDGAGQELITEKLDKQTWQLIATETQITVSYSVFAFDLSVRTAYLDNQRGFFNGSSLFLVVEEFKDSPCQLTIKPAPGITNWRVATGLTRAQATEKYSFGVYQAQNYAELIDGPVAIGNFDAFEFTVHDVVHHLVFVGKHYGDRQRISRDVAKICQHHIDLFGEAPFSEYWFITQLSADGFGGLEHKNSTVLQASRFDLPNVLQPEQLSDDYQKFLSLCSHEYFHAWHVCRIKPQEFIPYDLQKEVYTRQLWAFEGITSYYDDFSLFRAGIISFDAYLTLLGKTATRVYRGQGELKQSVSSSSFEAWTKFYQQGADAINNIVSYYTKGCLIALWLDLTIREKSHGRHSLDTLMRELWCEFGETTRGTHEQDFIRIASALCDQDLSAEFNALLHTASRVKLDCLLANVGVDMRWQKFTQLNSVDCTASLDYQPYIGAHCQEQPSGLKITSVLEQSPAANAGLAVNDVLIAVDGLKVTAKSLQNLVMHLPEHTTVTCHYFRDDQLLTGELTVIDSPATGVTLLVVDELKCTAWQNIVRS